MIIKYGLHNKLTAIEGKGNALAGILIEASQLVAAQAELYMVSRDAENENVIWVTEVWESEEAHDASLRDPDVRALIGQAMPLLEGMPEKGLVLNVLGGAGLAK